MNSTTVAVFYKDIYFLKFLRINLMPFGAHVIGSSGVTLAEDFYQKNQSDIAVIEEELAQTIDETAMRKVILPNSRDIYEASKINSRAMSRFALNKIWEALFAPRASLDNGHINRRRHERIETSAEVNWRPMLDLEFREGHISNVSHGGFGLNLPGNAPSLGEIIEVSGRHPLHSYCVVRWVRTDPGTHSNKVGLEFIATNKLVQAGLF